MSRPLAVELELDASALELLRMAALGAGIVLRAEVIAFVLSDSRGVSIVPKPGVACAVIREMRDCDWDEMLRSAEEVET